MANNVDLYTFASLANDTSATTNLNSNSAIITTALANTLALDGTQPNSLQADLDMNNFAINNLPLAVNQTSPLRLMDVSLLNGGGSITAYPLPTGGITGQVLAKTDNGNYDVTWTSPQAVTTTGSTSLTLTGSNLGTAALTGDVTSPSNSFVTTIASNAVTGAKFRGSAGLSLVGNPTNGTANVSDLVGTANQIPSVNSAGNSLGFVSVTGDVTNSGGTFTVTPGAISTSKIAANGVQNSNLAQSGSTTLKGNPTNSSTNVTDFTIQGLTNNSSPSGGSDYLPIYNHTTGTIQSVTPNQIISAGVAGVSSIDTVGGAFTTGNGITSTGSEIQLTSARRTLPTRQVLTSGTTYTTPANCLYIRVQMVGGGGGGGGAGTSASSGSAAGNGGTTSFNSVTAVGGSGGSGGGATFGVSGLGGTGGTGSASIRVNGNPGTGTGQVFSGGQASGTSGGGSFFGGGGAGTAGTGQAGSTNSGAGGGGGTSGTTGSLGGGGGGSGEYVELIITSPTSTYTYAIGAGVSGGGAGAGSPGGAGAAGRIIVDEFYGS